MVVKYKNMKIQIEELVIIAFFSMLFSPLIRTYLSNYFVCLLFTTFHELSHIACGAIFGLLPKAVRIRLAGLNADYIKTEKARKWIIIYFAGPIANLVLAIIFYNITFVFEINMALFLINIIPIKPLDGFNIISRSCIKKHSKYYTKDIGSVDRKSSYLYCFYLQECITCYLNDIYCSNKCN